MRFLLLFISLIFSGIFFFFARQSGDLSFFSSGNRNFYGETFLPNIIYGSLFFLLIGGVFFVLFSSNQKEKDKRIINFKELISFIKTYKIESLYLGITLIFTGGLYFLSGVFLSDPIFKNFFLFSIHILSFYFLFFVNISTTSFVYIVSRISALFLLYIVSILGAISILTKGENIFYSAILVYSFVFNVYFYLRFKNIFSACLSLFIFGILTYVYFFNYLVGIIYK